MYEKLVLTYSSPFKNAIIEIYKSTIVPVIFIKMKIDIPLLRKKL